MAAQQEQLTMTRSPALAFILTTVFLDMLAMGLVLPVVPKLILAFVGGDTTRAATLFGLFVALGALMQFLVSPLLGALSDRFGRRPVILLTCLGLGLDYCLIAAAPNLLWLFIGRAISGITSANVATASAYIADVTPEEKRAASFGLFGATFAAGFVLGPAIGGLLGGISLSLPAWIAAGLCLLNVAYGVLVLPESLRPEHRAPIDWKRANPLGALQWLGANRQLQGLTSVNFLCNLAHQALPSLFVLYTGYRYQWSTREVGLALSVVGLSYAAVQAGLVRVVVARIGERRALIAGLITGAAGIMIFGLAHDGLLFVAGIPLMAVWGLAGPSLQSLMTRHVSASEQGQLQGAQASVIWIAALLGPALFTFTFSSVLDSNLALDSVSALSGAPFILAALLQIAAAALAWHLTETSPIQLRETTQ